MSEFKLKYNVLDSLTSTDILSSYNQMINKLYINQLISLGVLLTLSNFSFAQNYIDYHKRRMVAEQAIMDTNYAEALAIYDSLFSEYDFVFAQNCYTACQTAIEIGNMDKAFSFMKQGVLQGLKMER